MLNMVAVAEINYEFIKRLAFEKKIMVKWNTVDGYRDYSHMGIDIRKFTPGKVYAETKNWKLVAERETLDSYMFFVHYKQEK